MPKSELDEVDLTEFRIEFQSIDDLIETLQVRQKTLGKYIKKAKTSAEKKIWGERIEEVDHFIDLIRCSNLTIDEPGYKKTPLSNYKLKHPGPEHSNGKAAAKPLRSHSSHGKKGVDPKEGSKKSQILHWIRANPKVTARQVAAALGFAENSVSAHIHALGQAALVSKADGLYSAS